jgi:hypothetical protein
MNITVSVRLGDLADDDPLLNDPFTRANRERNPDGQLLLYAAGHAFGPSDLDQVAEISKGLSDHARELMLDNVKPYLAVSNWSLPTVRDSHRRAAAFPRRGPSRQHRPSSRTSSTASGSSGPSRPSGDDDPLPDAELELLSDLAVEIAVCEHCGHRSPTLHHLDRHQQQFCCGRWGDWS